VNDPQGRDDGPTAVAHGLDEVVPGPSVVTIGNFDGVHRGHRVLLRRAIDAAHETDVRSVAVTFDPHPAAVLRPGTEPLAIQPLEDRIAELLALGVDLVLVLPFTTGLSSLGPDVFLEQVLVERLQATKVIVGANFRFGHKAAGDVITLSDAGERYGFDTEAVTILDLDGAPISSTELRRRIGDEGDLAWANRALGRPFTLAGEVVRGDQRGRTIGFPTANIEVSAARLLPANGVYAGVATVGDSRFAAVTNVGTRPTFDGEGVTVEVHLLDADLDLYGEHLTVSFLHRLRGEQRFDGLEALQEQIGRDASRARDLVGAEV
jgi:riboflavin kinase / FMN adenylyltransferase